MTSLCPGTLFSFSGLNRKSTPTPPQITAEELSKRYKRESFNGRPWPNASPTAGVYDIGFTSTKLILLNYQRKKECKLRGRNDPAMDADIFPNPGRHSRSSTPNQKEKHKKCYDSSSPYYKAPRVGNLDWMNYEMTAEERFKFEDGSMVNPRHHTSCLVSSDPNAFRMGMTYSGKRPSSPTSLPPNFRSSPMLTHKDLNKGEKQYLYSIAKIYSASQMMKLKQEQYNQLLAREMEKGLYTEDEYQQYLRYIQMGRKRQYLRSQGRAASAPLMRMFDNADNRRPGLYPSSVRDGTESRPMSQRETASDKPSRPASKKSTRSLRPTVPARTSISSDFTPSKKETSDQTKSKPDSAHQKKEKEDLTSQTKESSQKSGDKEESSDTSESTPWDPNRKNVQKEGVDRPRSRIGHIPEDAKSSKSFESSEQDTTSRDVTSTTKQSKEEEQQQKEEQIKEEQQKQQMKEEQQIKEEQQKQQMKEEQQIKEEQQKQIKEEQQKQQIKEEQQKQQIKEEQQKQQIKEEQQKQQIKEEQQKQQIKEEQQFLQQEEKQNEEEGKSEEEQHEEEPSKQKEDAEEAAEDQKSSPEEDKNEDKEDEARASPGSIKDEKTQKEKSSSESEHGIEQGSQQRRDSSSSYEIDEVSKVNKDPDKLEY